MTQLGLSSYSPQLIFHFFCAARFYIGNLISPSYYLLLQLTPFPPQHTPDSSKRPSPPTSPSIATPSKPTRSAGPSRHAISRFSAAPSRSYRRLQSHLCQRNSTIRSIQRAILMKHCGRGRSRRGIGTTICLVCRRRSRLRRVGDLGKQATRLCWDAHGHRLPGMRIWTIRIVGGTAHCRRVYCTLRVFSCRTRRESMSTSSQYDRITPSPFFRTKQQDRTILRGETNATVLNRISFFARRSLSRANPSFQAPD